MDDGITAGFGTKYEEAMKMLKLKLDVRKEAEYEFKFLGRWIRQDKNSFDVKVDQHDYVQQIEPIAVPLLRRKQREADLQRE